MARSPPGAAVTACQRLKCMQAHRGIATHNERSAPSSTGGRATRRWGGQRHGRTPMSTRRKPRSTRTPGDKAWGAGASAAGPIPSTASTAGPGAASSPACTVVRRLHRAALPIAAANRAAVMLMMARSGSWGDWAAHPSEGCFPAAWNVCYKSFVSDQSHCAESKLKHAWQRSLGKQ